MTGTLALLLGAWLAAQEGLWNGAVVVGIVFGIFGAFEMQAAWRLRRALAAFADALPAEGREAYQKWTGEQGIRWPALDIAVWGRVLNFGVHRILYEGAAGAGVVKPKDARRTGEEVAARLAAGGRHGRVVWSRRTVHITGSDPSADRPNA